MEGRHLPVLPCWGAFRVRLGRGGRPGAHGPLRRGFLALPVLATIRTSVEGGEAYLDDEEYCALVRSLASFAGGVDVEISRDGSSSLLEDAHEAGAIVVASFHDFEGTPGDEQLAEVLAAMNYAGADVLKFACMANSATDAARVLAAQAWAREAYDRPVIGISMGEHGASTRLDGLCPRVRGHLRDLAWLAGEPPPDNSPSNRCALSSMSSKGRIDRGIRLARQGDARAEMRVT